MKISKLIEILSFYDENTEVYIPNKEGRKVLKKINVGYKSNDFIYDSEEEYFEEIKRSKNLIHKNLLLQNINTKKTNNISIADINSRLSYSNQVSLYDNIKKAKKIIILN